MRIKKRIQLSKLPKTWLIDIDGVIFIHNSHLEKGDVLIDETKKFIDQLPKEDVVILMTARTKLHESSTKESLKKYRIKYDQIIFNMPVGERIIINDIKPGGLKTAYAHNTKRDAFKPPPIRYK